MKRYASLLAIVLMLTQIFVPLHTAHALTDDQIKALQSGVHYFNTEVDAAGCITSGSATVLAGNTNAEKVWNYLTQKMGLNSVQASGAMGNMEQEGGFNPDALNPDSGAFGIVQWLGGRKQGLQDFATQQGKPINDLGLQLDYMKQELEGSYKASVLDPLKAATTLEDAVRVWLEHYEVPCSPPGSACDPEMAIRLPKAQSYMTTFGSGTPASGSPSSTTSTSSCTSGSGAGSGDILKTALGLAWPDNGHGNDCSAATPAFIAAHEPIYGSDDSTHCTGCDVFVSTVMRTSGVDPDYPTFQTSVQLPYIISHPEKYQIIGTTNGDNLDPLLQPGDILAYYVKNPDGSIDGHTLIYTGPLPSGYNMVDGSNGGHVPQSGHWGSGGWNATYTIARVIK